MGGVVNSTGIVGLGAIAGFTIYLGLPIGRLRRATTGLRATLNAVATGILLFLLWDVLSHAVEPIEQVLPGAGGAHPSWARFTGLAAIFAIALAVGLLSLVYYEEWMARRGRPALGTATASPVRHGPGAMSVKERPAPKLFDLADPARRLSLLIAIGIGLHNLAEGLTIGQSAASGELSLAVMLIIGFGLHNATEGFGILGPMVAVGNRPSWPLLGVFGLIGGGPTFVGTVIGQSFVNDEVYLAFLALAAGSILYVVTQLLKVAAKLGTPRHLYWGLLGGLLAGFATDFIVTAAGA
jgi:zinc transporter, ZIP family